MSEPTEKILPWRYLQEHFKVVGERGKNFRVQCVMCLPDVSEVSCGRNTSTALLNHLRHRHPAKAASILNQSRKRNWRRGKSGVTKTLIRKAPRKLPSKFTPGVIVPAPEEVHPRPTAEPLIPLRDIKEEIVSNASTSHVASDSVDSGIPDVMEESSMNFEFVNSSPCNRYNSGPVDTNHNTQMCSVASLDPRTAADEQSCADIFFLRSLLPDFSKMTPRQKHKFKLAILNAVDAILYD